MAGVVVTGLSKRFGKVEALKEVGLVIGDGRFVALMGPSGCGKTTLLRLLSGLETADRGTIAIGARDVTQVAPEQRNIGLMFQSYALFPHMTVAENLAFPMRMRRGYGAAERERRIRNALDLVRLPAVADRYPGQLSGGQQQRVAFARALIDEPDVVLLDEPLSNLDARLRDEMQVELVEMRARLPITTILVTHDQTEGLTLADEIVVMRDGRIEQAGAPRAVYSDPATAFVADFLGGANLVPVEIVAGNGAWRARAGDGTMVSAPAPKDGAPGAATLMIRQEHLRVQRAGETVDSARDAEAEARIVAVAYRGQAAQIVVDALGQRLRLIADAGAAPAAGDAARIAWPLNEARLIR
jgi:ABC-type Fe3+/spermidine/putrescine transport system ATPase subunit